jgi:hypothetical protein
VRRLVLLTVGALLALTVGIAYAVTNTVTYTGNGSHKTKPSKTKPANFKYTGTLHIDTEPTGQQPEVAPRTTVFFDKGVKNNAKYFPFCNKAEIDGQETIPAKCSKAIVGTGKATAYAGSPGSPKENNIKEDLSVKAINGPKGTTLFLVVTSTPDAPVTIKNRVIPGTVKRSSGAFGFAVQFDIPEDLQEPVPGVPVSLTDFSVTIPATARRVKVGKVFMKISYLQETVCKGHHSVKAISNFKDATTGQLKPVTSTSSGKC